MDAPQKPRALSTWTKSLDHGNLRALENYPKVVP